MNANVVPFVLGAAVGWAATDITLRGKRATLPRTAIAVAGKVRGHAHKRLKR